MDHEDQNRENARDSSSNTTSPPKKLARIKKETNRIIINLKESSVLKVNQVVEQIQKDLGIEDEKKIELIRNSIAKEFVPIDKVKKVVQDAIEDKIDLEDEKEDEKKHYIEHYESSLKDYVEHYTRLHESALKDKDAANQKIHELENQINLKEWPNKIRNIVFNVEGEFDFGSWHVCKHCTKVHKEPDCSDNRKLYPKQAKERRIFERRQKWLCFIFENNAISARMVKSKLEIQFNRIKSANPNQYTEGEKFVASLPNAKQLIFYFCDSIARIFEYFSFELKQEYGIEQEIIQLGIFTPPNDIFMAWFVNSFVLMKADGEIKYTSPTKPIPLNSNADDFLEHYTINLN